MRVTNAIVLLIAALAITPAFAQDNTQIQDNMQILAEKLKADKKFVIAQNMQLTESEAKGFWPVYESYQKDLQEINVRLGKLILNYADAFNKGPVPNQTAKQLLSELLAVEESDVTIRRNYVPKLEKVLPEWKVARYIQLETKIRAIVKYELAARVPLVEGADSPKL
jgi:hypothetical protein